MKLVYLLCLMKSSWIMIITCKLWEHYLPLGNIHVSLVLAVTSSRECVCAGLRFLCVMSAHRLWSAKSRESSKAEVWNWMDLRQLEPNPGGRAEKVATKILPKASTERRRGESDPDSDVQRIISGGMVMPLSFSGPQMIMQSPKSSWICVWLSVNTTAHRKQ